MSTIPLLINSTSSNPKWNDVFSYYLEIADTFRAFFPNGPAEENVDNPLLWGRDLFLKLEGIHIEPWSGMADSIQVTGRLSPTVKDILRLSQEPAFAGNSPRLWSFELLRNNQVLLRVEDFSLCLLYPQTDAERNKLCEIGLDLTPAWEEKS